MKFHLTSVVQCDFPSVGLRYTAADAAHARLDEVLHLRGEGPGSAHYLHVVSDDVVAVPSIDGTTGDHTTFQRVL